ncbi:hypothetical protein ACKKBF_B37830 [Auxenochlorella protothecoides x Auxenochlorella symbiontica]
MFGALAAADLLPAGGREALSTHQIETGPCSGTQAPAAEAQVLEELTGTPPPAPPLLAEAAIHKAAPLDTPEPVQEDSQAHAGSTGAPGTSAGLHPLPGGDPSTDDASSSATGLGSSALLSPLHEGRDAGWALTATETSELHAAASVVKTMTQAMGLKVAELAPAEQVQLMHSVLTTWQVRLARTHGQAMVRQGEEANELRTGSLGVARAEARRRALVAVDRQLEAGLAAYRAAAADTLVFGLVVAAALALRWGAQRGAFAPLSVRCGALRWRGWAPWALLLTARRAACLLAQAANVCAGLATLCALPWVMHRLGLLDAGRAPLTRLVLGLGLGCGAAGRDAVRRLGGGTAAWTLVWGTWVGVHAGMQALGRLQAGRVRERARAALERDLEVAPPGSGLGGLTAALCLLQGVLLPATISWFTFYSLETGLEWGWW